MKEKNGSEAVEKHAKHSWQKPLIGFSKTQDLKKRR